MTANEWLDTVYPEADYPFRRVLREKWGLNMEAMLENFAHDVNIHRCQFTYTGVKYWVDPRPMAGTGAKRRRYYDHYYCPTCLSERTNVLVVEDDSYQQVKFNAFPLAKEPK